MIGETDIRVGEMDDLTDSECVGGRGGREHEGQE